MEAMAVWAAIARVPSSVPHLFIRSTGPVCRCRHPTYRYESLTPWGKEFPNSHRMPPSLPSIPTKDDPEKKETLKNGGKYLNYYRRALEAIKRWAEDPEMTVDMEVNGQMQKVKVCHAEEDPAPPTSSGEMAMRVDGRAHSRAFEPSLRPMIRS